MNMTQTHYGISYLQLCRCNSIVHLVSRQLQSALRNGDQSSATERMIRRRNKHVVVSRMNEGCMRET
jgi:hypothetical protein